MTEITADYFAPLVKELDRAVRIAVNRLDNCLWNDAMSFEAIANLLPVFGDIKFYRDDFRYWAHRFYHTTDEQTAYWAASDIIGTTKSLEEVLAKSLELLADELEDVALMKVVDAVDEVTRLGRMLRAQLTESQNDLDEILTYQWQNRHSS